MVCAPISTTKTSSAVTVLLFKYLSSCQTAKSGIAWDGKASPLVVLVQLITTQEGMSETPPEHTTAQGPAYCMQQRMGERQWESMFGFTADAVQKIKGIGHRRGTGALRWLTL